jgi:ABC-type branched-subunit amino acid transport system substrate-binding protein
VIVNKIDHADTPDGAIAACHQVLNNGSFTAVFGSGGADTAVIIANCFEEAHFVNFYNYAVKPKYKNWKYSYSMLTHTDDSLREAVTFIRNKLGHVNEKFGLICLNDETSKIDCDAFATEAKARGVDLVDTEYIEQNQAQFTSELLRLQKAGAQDVTIHALLESVGILRDAKAIQYTPHWTIGAFAFDFVTEAARDLFSGVTGLRNGATTDMSQYPVYQQKAQQYGTTSTVPGEALIVYGEGVVIGRALNTAGANPTQATLANGLDHTVTNWYDEITSPLTYTPTDHAGSHYAFPAICCKPDWTWKSLGPPATGW